MNQYIEVMKRTTELADTCLEGLEYVKKKLNEGHSESTMLLFHYVPGKGSARVNPGTAEFGPCGQRDSALQRGAEAVHIPYICNFTTGIILIISKGIILKQKGFMNRRLVYLFIRD